MKFLPLHLHLFHEEVEFGKDYVKCAFDSDEKYNLLFVGTPASAKTLFLLGILECRKGVYLDGSNITNRIIDVLGLQQRLAIDTRSLLPADFK